MSREEIELPQRSTPLKALVVGYLVLSLLGWLRVQQVISGWDWLGSLGINVSLWYIVISGICWGMVGLSAGLGLWFRQRWAPVLARLGAIFFSAWYWCDTLLVVQNDFSRANLPFMIGLNILCLLYVFICLALPGQKKYFNASRKSIR